MNKKKYCRWAETSVPFSSKFHRFSDTQTDNGYIFICSSVVLLCLSLRLSLSILSSEDGPSYQPISSSRKTEAISTPEEQQHIPHTLHLHHACVWLCGWLAGLRVRVSRTFICTNFGRVPHQQLSIRVSLVSYVCHAAWISLFLYQSSQERLDKKYICSIIYIWSNFGTKQHFWKAFL